MATSPRYELSLLTIPASFLLRLKSSSPTPLFDVTIEIGPASGKDGGEGNGEVEIVLFRWSMFLRMMRCFVRDSWRRFVSVEELHRGSLRISVDGQISPEFYDVEFIVLKPLAAFSALAQT